MSDVDYLLTARVALEKARSVLDAFGDDEGTE